MAQVRAYMMSFVGLQLTTGRDRFPERFPHPWLVWEPGAWHVPQMGAHRTQLPTHEKKPGRGDALCFEISLQPGGKLHAGRMDAHPLVINDATFSRDQFLIARPTSDSWTLEAMPNASVATIDGAPVTRTPVPLNSGSTIIAGDVTLRFYQPFDFVARIDTEIAGGKL